LYVTAVESEDYTILHPDNTVICQVKTSRNVVATDDDDDDVDAGDVPSTETHDEGAAAASNDA
ncbi:50S ribosomal protein L25, partial [Aquimarina celericrescens]|nr:50S ribosomal protein L25 [Aquimarina celericrescens]